MRRNNEKSFLSRVNIFPKSIHQIEHRASEAAAAEMVDVESQFPPAMRLHKALLLLPFDEMK